MSGDNSSSFDLQNLFGVKGKHVLVTGGGKGIGLMISAGFVENGATVYISSRSKKDCDEAAEHLNRLGKGTAVSIPCDLTKLEEQKKLVEEIKKHTDKLHVLVNNSGNNWGAPFDKYPDEAWSRVLTLNLHRVFTLTQLVTPLLQQASAAPSSLSNPDPARVINIGSVDGIRTPWLETFAYSASKAGVHHMTEVLSHHLGKRGITVNCIAPGPFQSKMMAATLDKFSDKITGGIPLGRIGTPEDVAGTCIWLASRAGAYVNGAIVLLDGGSVKAAKL